jgi:hypothetical protein
MYRMHLSKCIWILGIENRKPKLKIENWIFFSFQAGNNYQKKIYLFIYLFIYYFNFIYFLIYFSRVRADAGVRPRGPAPARTPHVRTDAVFTASADGKNPSAGKTASAG